MDYYSDAFLDKLKFIFSGVMIIAGLLMLTFLVSSIEIKRVQAEEEDSTSSTLIMDMSNSPNLISKGMATATTELSQTMSSVTFEPDDGIKSIASTTVNGGKAVAHGVNITVATTVNGIGSVFSYVGNTLSGGIVFILSIPGNVLGFALNIPAVNAIIKPSDHAEVQIIDPNSPELLAAVEAMPPKEKTGIVKPQSSPVSEPAWPIHGRVTTKFGVSHWPYQRIHTGLDISDGQVSGVTPVKPFRPGRVVEAVNSRRGLGNHVVVDHGSGVTSVYGHLDSISVKQGQELNMTTLIGFEGSTGTSTGTHLHFDIRVNGRAADPHQFISGQP